MRWVRSDTTLYVLGEEPAVPPAGPAGSRTISADNARGMLAILWMDGWMDREREREREGERERGTRREHSNCSGVSSADLESLAAT